MQRYEKYLKYANNLKEKCNYTIKFFNFVISTLQRNKNHKKIWKYQKFCYIIRYNSITSKKK